MEKLWNKHGRTSADHQMEEKPSFIPYFLRTFPLMKNEKYYQHRVFTPNRKIVDKLVIFLIIRGKLFFNSVNKAVQKC